jgi:6,7-dimethyl-8-ribityllumazine synthase
MPHILECDLKSAAGTKFAIVVARFNDLVTRKLLDGAVATLTEYGIADNDITIAWAPGSFEIPLVADTFARSGRFAAVICLGAVVQGETLHHKYINAEVSRAIMEIAIDTGIPVLFGVLTCRNMEQALARAGGKAGNKGSEAALAALEMVGLLQKLNPLPA